MRIPFLPFPVNVASTMSKSFLPLSNVVAKFFPNLELQLAQSNIPINIKVYLSLALFAFMFWSMILFITTFPLLYKISVVMSLFSVVLSLTIGFVVFLNIIYYPRLLITRRIRDIEKNLVFAMRHIVIQIKSGVPLFDSFESIASAGYGFLSVEFGNLSKQVASGVPITEALENLIYRNPSVILRRTLWHIINSIKAGVDIGDSLSLMLQNLSQEQMVEIRKYGSQLNPLALMYMMFAVIIPTLGLTFLLVFSMFAGFEFQQSFFILFLVALAVFQFSFIGIIKNRRPQIEL